MLLSDVDIVRNLGKGITIHPLTKDTISGAHIRLTASEYVYSCTPFVEYDKLKDTKYGNKSFQFVLFENGHESENEVNVEKVDGDKSFQFVIVEKNKNKVMKLDYAENVKNAKNNKICIKIKVKEHSKIHILPKERICLDAGFQGDCKLRVDLGLNGFEMVPTPIKPGSAGYLTFVIENTDDEHRYITIGDRIVVVEIHQLSSKAQNPLSGVANFGVLNDARFYTLIGINGHNHIAGNCDCDKIKSDMIETSLYKEVINIYKKRIKEDDSSRSEDENNRLKVINTRIDDIEKRVLEKVDTINYDFNKIKTKTDNIENSVHSLEDIIKPQKLGERIKRNGIMFVFLLLTIVLAVIVCVKPGYAGQLGVIITAVGVLAALYLAIRKNN